MCFPNKARKLLLLTLLAGALSNCSMPLPGFSLLQTGSSGTPLASGETSNVHFFTKETLHNTGIALQSGQDYSLAVRILSNWVDLDIAENENGEALNERGFDNSLMPIEMLELTKRARSNNWFELMLVQQSCSGQSLAGVTDLTFDEESNSYRYTASCDGALSLFVNDTLGFYGNNIGYANIAISRLD
ncbi:MAG: hypothetical protein AB8B95_02705 [Pseudohongiellaceae bacterium]